MPFKNGSLRKLSRRSKDELSLKVLLKVMRALEEILISTCLKSKVITLPFNGKPLRSYDVQGIQTELPSMIGDCFV